MLLRASGRVTRIEGKDWQKDDRKGTIWTANVLVADLGVAIVNIPDRVKETTFRGQDVDWLVEVEASRFGLQARFVEPMPSFVGSDLDALSAP